MIKKTILAVLIFFGFNLAFSQGKFEKGYFIDNNNKRIECLVKNLEWEYTPIQFEYKTDQNAVSQVKKFDEFLEFGVAEEYRFIKTKVNIDKSGDSFENATGSKAMNFVEELLILRVRVEGKANLYSYKNENYSRFFYSTETTNSIQPLSFKFYYDNIQKAYRHNETFKQELFNNLKCEKITQNDIDRLEYTDSSLYNFFVKYNTCFGAVKDNYTGQKNHETFEFYAKAGLGMSGFKFDYQGYNADFTKKLKVKFGLETEINLSNRYKKWSILLEAVYQQYKNTYQYDFVNPVESEVDYKSIDASFGLRKYFALTPKYFLFANGYLTYGLAMNSEMKTTTLVDLEFENSFSLSLGVGCLYNKRYLAEIRYEFPRNAFGNPNVDSEFTTIGLIFGYKFL